MKKTILVILLITGIFGLFNQAFAERTDMPNVLLLCIDDLRPELNCFSKSYIKSPNIDSLAKAGVSFQRHYVQAPSCGPSRYTLLTGQYGLSSNEAIFMRSEELKKKPGSVAPSMPEWFRKYGYTTVSVGKVSHHPGGMGGQNWDKNTILEMPNAWDRCLMPVGEWQHPRGAMHGLANGEIRKNAKDMAVFQAIKGSDTIYPDGLIVSESLKQLDILSKSQKPFFLAVGILKPHLPFGCPAKYFDIYKDVKLPMIPFNTKPKDVFGWHSSVEFMKYKRWGRNPNIDTDFADEVRRHYAACVSYADALVGKIMQKLRRTGADKNTIIVLWGDHGWHLGEHHIWGKHSLYEESLRSPLILSYPGMRNSGMSTDAIVGTVDLFPTLCELAALEVPDFAVGRSLKPILDNPAIGGGYALSYWKELKSIRSDTHRLIINNNGDVRLYDHRTPEKETVDLSGKEPDLVLNLTGELERRLRVISSK